MTCISVLNSKSADTIVMKKPTPINKEVPFDVNDLFFSTTDHKGVIEFGNEVFINTSGYSKDDLFGAPHNIIRHPDMPKSVFKLFWDSLKAQKPICAYVKNMSKNGGFYWVFASAFPVENKYLSIRFKPTSDLFKTVEDLYQEVLHKEKTCTVQEAELFLLQKLSTLGFKSYEDFMTHAVVKELTSFEGLISHDSEESTDLVFKKISDVKNTTSKELTASFNLLGNFTRTSNHFAETMGKLTQEFRKLSMLSLNMNIVAAKFGDRAATLSVIATQFSSIANQIEVELTTFTKFTNDIVDAVSKSSLNLSALKVQMNMVDFFIKESIRKSATTENAFEEMMINESIFTTTFAESNKKLLETLTDLKTDLRVIEAQVKTVVVSVSGLEIVKQVASIESSRSEELRSAFKTYIDEMLSFTKFLKTMMDGMSEELKSLSADTNSVLRSTDQVKGNIKLLFDLTMKGKVK